MTIRKNPLEKEICELEVSILETKKILSELRKKLPAEEVKNYELTKLDASKVSIKELFGEHDEMLLVHNMGKYCPYCTLWADGFKGLMPYIKTRCAFVLENDMEIEKLDEFCSEREWNFDVVSSLGSGLKEDLGYKIAGENHPGVTSLYLKDDKIYKHATASFGPGDEFCSVWGFLDLLKNQHVSWQPNYNK